MIQRIIEWSLKNRFLVFCGALLLITLGVRAVFKTPVDAIPDLTENQVLVYADWMGRSPQEVEDQVTYPLSTGLQGTGGREGRAGHFDVRLLAHHHHFRGQHRHLLSRGRASSSG
jgi:Cu/Ag efflux pump CusA